MRLIIIIKIYLILTLNLNAQNFLHDSLMLCEYKVFKANTEAEKQEALIKKVKLYIGANELGEAIFNEIKRVNTSAISDINKKRSFLWNAATIAYLNEKTDHARYFISEYENISSDSSETFYLLSILANKYHDTALVNSTIKKAVKKDSLFKTLSCFMDAVNYNKKHYYSYIISSAVVPGLGTALNGKVLKGSTSLALNAISLYAVVKLAESGLYTNAVLWGLGLGVKFYIGNLNLTDKTFYEAEQKHRNKILGKCEVKLKELLSKYPIILSEL